VTLDPEDFFPYVMRADLYEKTDQIALAIADYDKAIALNPYYSDLYQYRSELRYKIGDKDGAALDKQKYEELENE
jgi:tetratricopeptide (TPR) repeat protein